MLRLRSAAIVLCVALVAWLVAAYFAAGRDFTVTQRELGHKLADLGLASFGSILVNQASEAYKSQVESADPPDEVALQQHAECELELAAMFRRHGNAKRARHYYERAAETTPAAKAEAKWWTSYLNGLEDEPGARRELLAASVDHPEASLPPYLAGRLFLREEKTEQARSYLEQSIALTGGDTYRARQALVDACDVLGDTEPATEHAQRALELAVTAGEKRAAAIRLGDFVAEPPPALRLWAETFARNHATDLTWLGAIVLVLMFPLWLTLLSRVLPSVAARIYMVGGSSDPAAITAYETALKRTPNDTRLLWALASAYQRVGVGATRSAELYEQLWTLRPDDESVLTNAAMLAVECGRETDIAARACQAWFELNPDDPNADSVASHIGRVYRA